MGRPFPIRDDRDKSGPKRDLGEMSNVGNQNKKSRVKLVTNAPRPTREFDFVWKPLTKMLRITCTEGEPHKAKWVDLSRPNSSPTLPSHEMTNQAQPSTIRRPTQQASTSKDPTSWAPMLNPSPTGPVDQVVILSKSSPDEDEQGIIPKTSRPSFCDPSPVTLKGNSLPKDDSDEDEVFAESSEIRDFIQPIISET